MREVVKRLVRGIAFVVVLPMIVSFEIRSRLMGRNRALEGSTQALAVVPGVLGQFVRRAFLSWALAYCAPSATIEFGTIFSQAGARIDAYAYVGPRCHLGLVHIEREVLVAAGVHIPSGGATHGIDDPDRPIRDQPGQRTRVRVGQGAWIGSNAVVLADVGAHSVIGAGAVVTQPIPDYVIAAGVPAKVIRSRRTESVGA